MRKRVRTVADTNPNGHLKWPNGSEVFTPKGKLKGYIVNHAPGRGDMESFTVDGVSVGKAKDMPMAMALLDGRKARLAVMMKDDD